MKVLVGEEQTPYYHYKAVLSRYSRFFRAALEGSWEESRSGVVKLPEQEPVAFDILSSWLYYQDVKARCDSRNSQFCMFEEETDTDNEANQASGVASLQGAASIMNLHDARNSTCSHYPIMDLILAYVLGDMLQCSKFKNCILDEILDYSDQHRRVFGGVHATVIYKSTGTFSPLRKLLVDLEVYTGAEILSPVADDEKGFPMEHLHKVRRRLIQMRNEYISGKPFEMPFRKDFCGNYHVHEDGEPRCNAMA